MSIFHGGDVWQAGVPSDWLDFSANLNPDGPPEWVVAVLAEGLQNARFYPDARSSAAVRGLSEHLGVPEDCVLPTNGGIEAAAIAAGLFERHAVAQPTFQEYGRLCARHRDVAWAALADFAPEAGECLWLCNPNNPTGAALTRENVLALLARIEAAGGFLAVDEAFIHCCPERSAIQAASERPALIVLGSLTKALAIPGVRLGYLAAHPSVIAALREKLPPWRLNCLAEAVAAALPGHAADFARMRALNAERREAFAEALRALGAEVLPSEASFLLGDFHRDMRPVIGRLKERRVLVRPCGRFPGLTDGHVRLAVRTEAQNARLIEALREELES